MCTLALYFRQSERYPVVVAANRDEFLARPATAPLRAGDDPWIIAGIDLAAGGTWLGVNQHDLVVGLLNRRSSRPPDPERRSRGLLALEALRESSPEAAIALVERTDPKAYNPFHLLAVSPAAAFVARNLDDEVTTTPLPPGVHLLTNLDLNDPTCPRIAKSSHLFRDGLRFLASDDLTGLVEHLRSVLSDHSTPLDPRAGDLPDNLCVHRGAYGTRSSTLLSYRVPVSAYLYLHADGPPCSTPYAEVPLPPKA